VDTVGADESAVAEQAIEDLAQELALKRLLLLPEQSAGGSTGALRRR
jgi:hypothetical protein